jgi:hypothetical protein
LSLQNGIKEDVLFNYARAIKAFEVTQNCRLPPNELQMAFSLWWQEAKPLLPEDADFDEYRFTFEDSYSKTRAPLGANHLEQAIRRADTLPLPPEATRYTGKLKRLVGTCYHLQVLAAGAAFFLSTRDAARILGKKRARDGMIALNGLVRDGVLSPVEKGRPGGRRASRFRYNTPPIRQHR